MNVNLFLPNSVKHSKRNVSFKGYISIFPENLFGLYLIETDNTPEDDIVCQEETFTLFGDVRVNNSASDPVKRSLRKYRNYVYIELIENDTTIEYLKINNIVFDTLYEVKNTLILFYNYEAFVKSEDLILTNEQSCSNNSTAITMLNQFQVLKRFISNKTIDVDKQKKNDESDDNNRNSFLLVQVFIGLFTWIAKYSNLLLHFGTTLKYISWISSSIFNNRKISVKVGNLIIALIVDVIAGIVLLNWINKWSPTLISKLFELIYIIIPSLQKLLLWLMGSPAGLKLNHAFNNMLGKFFLYHIDLWWMFLEICRYMMEIAIKIFQYLGMLGISFQATIITDLLSLATFHVYCIYIYAARLYNVQLSGLIALWRLFLGRKHNPLRECVDSCQYDHHQLFIGTLGFTILLFLLPTTLMYYVVFTAFRVLLLILNVLLKWIQFIIQSLPLYLVILWFLRSKRIAGDIHISVDPNSELKKQPLIISVQLRVASLVQLIKVYMPEPIPAPPKLNYKEIISSLWRGKVLNTE